MTTAAFAAACLLDPWDDTRRLVMADWMEESGDVDRASLVRLQVEMERMGECEAPHSHGQARPCRRFYRDTLDPGPSNSNAKSWCQPCRDRERLDKAIASILDRHTGDKATGERWDRVCCPNPKCKDGWERVGSLASSEGTTAIGWSVGCRTCIGGQGDLALHTTDRGLGSRSLHWDRGFLHLGCQIAEAVEERECDSKDCRNGWQLDGAGGIATDDLTWERIRHARCSGSGRIPTLTAWGRAVVDSGCGLWLEGVEPIHFAGSWVYLDRRRDPNRPNSLPDWLWKLWNEAAGGKASDSPDAAKLELARSFTAWAARQAKEAV